MRVLNMVRSEQSRMCLGRKFQREGLKECFYRNMPISFVAEQQMRGSHTIIIFVKYEGGAWDDEFYTNTSLTPK